MKKFRRWLLVACAALVATVVLASITGAVVLLRVPTSAMEPTFKAGDHILFRYKRGLTEADRDRVVYFRVSSVPFLYDSMQREENVIKRVAGLPGDTISMAGQKILINGQPRATMGNYLKNEYQLDLSSPIVVPTGYFYALGDNDSNSVDSRMYGFVSISGINGIAIKESNKPDMATPRKPSD